MARVVIRIQKRAGLFGWWIRVGGLDLLSGTQASATRRAVNLAKEHHAGGGKAQVVLHGADGRIRWERSYPDDTPRRKG